MSKDYTFNPGDFVVYPAHGVGQVTERQTTTVAGQNLDLIAVHFTKDKMTMKIPSNQALDKGLRQVATPVMMETVEKVLRKKAKAKRIQWSKRSAEYTMKIGSGDPIALAEVIRELYKDPAIATQTYSERQLYEKAMGRLAPEYAIVHDIPETEAMAKIEGFLAGTDSAE
ncbi:MAG: CarD family transcriptional regulator [Alphaproteobacteria bacterium]|nr:CarD family transcriptional regulator [Alphaproteobacteria bacterium]